MLEEFLTINGIRYQRVTCETENECLRKYRTLSKMIETTLAKSINEYPDNAVLKDLMERLKAVKEELEVE